MTIEELRLDLFKKSKIILKNKSFPSWIRSFKKEWLKAGGTETTLQELIEEFKQKKNELEGNA